MKRYFNQFMIAALLLCNPAVVMPMEQPAAQVAQCPLCFNESGDVEFRPLTCGHNEVCVDCLREQLNPVLDAVDLEEGMRVHLRCPNRACRAVAGDRNAVPPLMQPEDVRIIYGDDEARVDRFNEVVRVLNLRAETLQNEAAFNLFLAQNPNARRCPTEGCQWAYMLENGQNPANVQCDICRQQYCSHCHAQHRVGDRCRRPEELAGNNNNNAAPDSPEERARIEQERQNREWARRNIKRCPACQRNTHKFTGCNHMTCYRIDPYTQEFVGGCGHQFCWIDLRPWNGGAGHREHQFGEYPHLEVLNNQPAPGVDPVHPAVAPAEPAWNQPDIDWLPQAATWAPPAPPRRNYTPYYVIGGIAVASAISYGAYKLYRYLKTPKPILVPDLKTNLDNLHKEAIKAKNRMVSATGYAPGMLKNYFVASEAAQAYKDLDAARMVQLRKIVNDLEVGLCAHNCDTHYAALVNFIIAFKKSATPSVEVVAPVPVKPVVVEQPQVKKTPVRGRGKGLQKASANRSTPSVLPAKKVK